MVNTNDMRCCVMERMELDGTGFGRQNTEWQEMSIKMSEHGFSKSRVLEKLVPVVLKAGATRDKLKLSISPLGITCTTGDFCRLDRNLNTNKSW